MNKEEVKKALEYCINAKGMNDCSNCKFSLHPTCRDMIMKEALQLINEQEEEIEMLEQDIDGCGEEIERLEKAISDQNEQCWNCNKSVKYFAEKLKAKLFSIFGKTICSDFDTEDITLFIDEVLAEYENEKC